MDEAKIRHGIQSKPCPKGNRGRKSVVFITSLLILTLALTAFGCPKKSTKKPKNKGNVEQESTEPAETAEETESGENQSTATNKTINKFAFIKSITTNGGKDSAKVDYADFLTGTAADKAAIAAGEIQPGEHVDNDYYISNKNPKIRTFSISPAVKVIAETYNMQTTGKVGKQSISFATFKKIIQTKPDDNGAMVANGYWLTITGNEITKFAEQYVP